MRSSPVYCTSLCALLSENKVKQSSITTGLISWDINSSSNSTKAGSLPARSLIPKIPKCKVKLEITDCNKSQECYGTDQHAFSLYFTNKSPNYNTSASTMARTKRNNKALKRQERQHDQQTTQAYRFPNVSGLMLPPRRRRQGVVAGQISSWARPCPHTSYGDNHWDEGGRTFRT
jgi:hypothetical protein